MLILQILYLTWGVYNYIGFASSIYGMFKMGQDGVILIYRVAKYVGRKSTGTTAPDLTESFLIEKRDLENNWQEVNVIPLVKR